MATAQGTVDPGFERVRELFEAQFSSGEHYGAAASMYWRGKKVVDLWGGIAEEATGRPWEADTMAVSYSTTKGLSAMCVHLLAERGLLQYEDRVAKFWPEFAANGKQDITVYHVLTHQAGVPQIPEGLTSHDLLDWDRVVSAIADLTPAWEPGTASGYHAMNFGWLTGEIVRRIDGRSIGTFLRDEIARPLGLKDMYIGAPASVEPQIAKLRLAFEVTPEMQEQRRNVLPADSLMRRALAPADDLMAEVLDSPEGHRAEIPAVSGIMTARDLARFYALYANYGELDGVRLFSEERVRRLSERQTFRPDKILIIPIGWALGYMTGQPGWSMGARTTAFGHPGFGGSIGFADPEIEMSFGLVLNMIDMDFFAGGRAKRLADVARECVAAVSV
jgi:CubicO group peptidase (beta-lactamase class C family)